MAMLGAAAMVAIYDLERGWESRHDDWHSHEHMLERVDIPGFLRGRRYLANDSSARCFVLYEAQSLEVLTSDAYLTRLNNPTPWSLETMPHFQNMTRTLCRVTVSAGRGLGGTMAYLPLSADPSRTTELRTRIAQNFTRLVEQPGVLAAHLLEGDDVASRIETREKELRGSADAVADWLLVIEGYGALGSVIEQGRFRHDLLLEMGAASVGSLATYSLSALLAQGET